MLNADALARLEGRRNLLAFSGGGDSTALFFLLYDAGIDFDLALVNYRTRPESDEEADYARQLAERHDKTCHIFDAPVIESNFEHEARRLRYTYFETLIASQKYETLVTAHHLGDRLEWMLMQLCKGSGVVEMAGMQLIDEKEGYALVRPLLECTKPELVDYLKAGNHRWFDDASNDNPEHRRNYFRHHFATELLERFPRGIRQSFRYLDEDIRSLDAEVTVTQVDRLFWFETPSNRRAFLITVDRILKADGFLMRQGDKELLKSEDTVVVGRRYVVWAGASYSFIAPYETTTLDKRFKEECRKLGVEPKLRPYLSGSLSAFEAVASLLGGGLGGVDLHGK
jgi:tRNA(Ile)-lysidine synthase